MLASAVAGSAIAATTLVAIVGLARLAGYGPSALADKAGQWLTDQRDLEALEARIYRLERALLSTQAAAPRPEVSQGLVALASAQAGAPPLSAAPTPTFADYAKVSEVDFNPSLTAPQFGGRTLKVCATGPCRYRTLIKAVDAAKDGDTIVLAPGLYTDCINNIKVSIAIVGEIAEDGTRATFDRACAGKAALNFSSPKFRVEGVQIQDITVSDGNGACIRLQPRRGTSQLAHVRNVVCQRSENGILGTVGPEGGLIIESSLFLANGFNGRAHGLYVIGGRETLIRNSIIHSSKGSGHSVKVGATRLFVESSIVAALNGDNSRAIDFFAGGLLRIDDSVIQQGPNSSNHELIGLAHENRRMNVGVPHAVYVSDSWLIYDDPARCCRWLMSGRATGEILFENNRVVALNGSRIEDYVDEDNTRFANRREAGLPDYTPSLASLPQPEAWSSP